jgi:hypothetical protein
VHIDLLAVERRQRAKRHLTSATQRHDDGAFGDQHRLCVRIANAFDRVANGRSGVVADFHRDDALSRGRHADVGRQQR